MADEGAKQQNLAGPSVQRTSTTGCWCTRNSRHILPAPGVYPGYEILEVRPQRFLRVRHINPSPNSSHPGVDKRSPVRTRKWMGPHFGHSTPTSEMYSGSRELSNNGSFHTDESQMQQTQSEECDIPGMLNTPSKDIIHTKINAAPPGGEDVNTGVKSDCINQNDASVEVSPINNVQFDNPVEGSHAWHTQSGVVSGKPPRATTASSVKVKVPKQGQTDFDVKQTLVISQQANNIEPLFKQESKSSLDTNRGFLNRGSRQNSFSSNINTVEQNAVLFFVHGVGGSSDVWQAQLDYFGAEGYEIIAPDLIGHGFSSAPKDSAAYDFKEIMEDLFVIFDKYSKKRNCVIGHSYGCSFAAVLARRKHRKVHKLVLVSGGAPIPLAPQPGFFALPTCMLACCRPILASCFKKSAFHGRNKTYIPWQKAFDVPTYVLKYTMNGQNWMEGDAEYHHWLQVAALLIHGAQDQLVSIEEEKEMERAIYGSRLVVVEDASHMVMLEKPNEVNHLIHAFLLKTLQIVGSASMKGVDTASTLTLLSHQGGKWVT